MDILEIYRKQKLRYFIKKYNQKINLVLNLSVKLETIKKRI